MVINNVSVEIVQLGSYFPIYFGLQIDDGPLNLICEVNLFSNCLDLGKTSVCVRNSAQRKKKERSDRFTKLCLNTLGI